jgi:hypothetical protein
MNSVLRLIHAKPRLLMSIIDISTIGRSVKLEDGMRADQESTRRFHQRRSSAVETPTVLRLLASGFGFRPHRSLGCKGERSFNPPESPRFRVGGDPNKPQSCKYGNSTMVRWNHCSRFRSVPSYCAGGLRPMAERWPESKFWKIRSVML